MDSWWWSNGVNVERATHLVTERSVYGAGFWGWWGHFPKLKGGKNECGNGRSRGFGIKSQNGKREGPCPLHFFFFFGKNSFQVWWEKRTECGESFEHLRKFWVHVKWVKREEKQKVWGFIVGRLYLGIFLGGSLEWGSARELLCAKANRRKDNLEANQISA